MDFKMADTSERRVFWVTILLKYHAFIVVEVEAERKMVDQTVPLASKHASEQGELNLKTGAYLNFQTEKEVSFM